MGKDVKLDINIDFSLYWYEIDELTEIDKDMIINIIKNSIRKEICSKLTTNYNNFHGADSEFTVADNDYIDVKIQ